MKIARLLLVVAFMSMSLSGHASTVTARQDSPAPKTSTVNVEIIVDASGSMAAETNTGELRIDSAKRVLTEVINAIPEAEGVNVGLRVYGHLGDNTDEGRMESCVSSDLLAPIEGVDKPSLLAQVDTLQPVGWTPIGYAQEQASADFTQPGSDDVVNAIVMVTDGLETCDADPAAIAGRLHASDAGITTHVIGFGTTPEEQAILSGIAEAGEGELLGSDNTGQLQAALFEVLEELDVVEETGTGESRESPLGIGRAGRVGDYDVSVILADAAIEESGTSGGRDFTVFVSLTFQGARSGTPSSDLQFVGVGDLGILYTEASNGCKDSLGGPSTESLFRTGSAEFSMCWTVSLDDVDSLVMYAESSTGSENERVWFSLQPNNQADTSGTSQDAVPEQLPVLLELQAIDPFEFSPTTLIIPANTDVTIILYNQGFLEHSFVIEGLDIDTGRLNGGETTSLTINLPRGTYQFVCDVPGHTEGGQVGTIIAE